MQRRQLLVSLKGVIHEPMEQLGGHIGGAVALHHGRLSSDRRSLGQKAMAIKPLTHQRHKQLAWGQLPAISADGSDRQRRIKRRLAPLRVAPASNQCTKLHGIRAGMAR